VVRVADGAGGQRLPPDVVLDVGGGDEHVVRPGHAEDRGGERRKAWRVDVLDHLRQHDRVVARDARVGVGDRALVQRDPRALTLREPVDPGGRHLQRPGRHVDTDDLRERRLRDQLTQQLPFATTEIHDPARAKLSQLVDDRLPALLRQRRHALGLLRLLRVLRRAVVQLGEPLESRHGEPVLVREVAGRDQLPVRVRRQPVPAGTQQFVDLVGRHPVVLRVVQHRQ
jgi:hypothetical protein